MTRILNSKYKICKSLKSNYKNLWGIKKKELYRSTLNKKKKRITVFNRLLNIKQSFRFFYSNIKEKNFKKLVKESIKSPCKTIDKLVSFTESRLDSILFRSCLVSSFHKARQLINHKFIEVNGRHITNPSVTLVKNDVVKIKIKHYDLNLFNEILLTRSIPNYLEVDLNNLRIIFLWDPSYENSYYPISQNYTNIDRYYK